MSHTSPDPKCPTLYMCSLSPDTTLHGLVHSLTSFACFPVFLSCATSTKYPMVKCSSCPRLRCSHSPSLQASPFMTVPLYMPPKFPLIQVREVRLMPSTEAANDVRGTRPGIITVENSSCNQVSEGSSLVQHWFNPRQLSIQTSITRCTIK